jgi:hypothetical protein
MRTKTTVAVGAVLVVGFVVLWPRGGGQVVDLLPPAPSPGPALGRIEAFQKRHGRKSQHARAIALAAAAPVEGGKEVGWAERVQLSMELALRPDDLRQAPLAEQIARLRSGEDWPSQGLVKGPPGKPALYEGVKHEDVLAAWGEPVGITPARVHERSEGETSGMNIPAETLRIEHNETWLYEEEGGANRLWPCFFEDGKLAERAHSAETERALRIESLLTEDTTLGQWEREAKETGPVVGDSGPVGGD